MPRQCNATHRWSRSWRASFEDVNTVASSFVTLLPVTDGRTNGRTDNHSRQECRLLHAIGLSSRDANRPIRVNGVDLCTAKFFQRLAAYENVMCRCFDSLTARTEISWRLILLHKTKPVASAGFVINRREFLFLRGSRRHSSVPAELYSIGVSVCRVGHSVRSKPRQTDTGMRPRSFPAVTRPRSNRHRRCLTSLNEPLSYPRSP